LGDKGGRCVGLIILPHLFADCPQIRGNSAFRNPPNYKGRYVSYSYENELKLKKGSRKKLAFYRDQDLHCITSLSRQTDFENIKNKKGSNFVTQ